MLTAGQYAPALAAMADAVSTAVKAFAKLGEQLRPAIEQAVRELNDCGYTYDASKGVFVRTAEGNPIAVHRLLRYIQRSPQNRRRVREWRKAARRQRKQGQRHASVHR